MPLFNLQQQKLSHIIKTEAEKLGFFACGISKARALPDEALRMEQWLAEGKHGEMKYLEKNREKRYDITQLVKNARSIISVLMNYFPEKELPDSGYKISKYAYGKDYHYVIKKRMALLLEKIESLTGKRQARIFTDSAPVLDRAVAQRAGLGFVGKNTLLINKKGGSFFFIGHIVIDLDLYPDKAVTENFCGSCTRCIDACPTKALTEFSVDARKCISYLTIEYRGEKIPEKFKNKWEKWIFGCDICQDVCPWNNKAQPTAIEEFKPSEKLKNMSRYKWEHLDKADFKELFKNTPVERTGFKGLQRNIKFLSPQQQNDNQTIQDGNEIL